MKSNKHYTRIHTYENNITTSLKIAVISHPHDTISPRREVAGGHFGGFIYLEYNIPNDLISVYGRIFERHFYMILKYLYIRVL